MAAEMLEHAINHDVISGKFKANPFDYYAYLRQHDPVHQVMMSFPNKQPVWLVTRYDDAANLLKDERFLKNHRSVLTPDQQKREIWMPAMLKAFERNMLDLDAPDHTRLRGLVHKVFTPKMIEQLRGRVQSLADELIDKVERQGEMDLIRDYALPIPATIIAEMLGVPAEDQDRFSKWSNTMVGASSMLDAFKVIPAMMAFHRYIKRLVNERRLAPKDDLLTALVQTEEAGDKLSEDELMAMVMILLIAGHETTVNLIGNGMLALLQHPDQLKLLRENPAYIKTAVEELVRFTCPVEKSTERYASEDITLAGVIIPRGQMALAVIASANRDASQFENPDTLDITRENNRHLGFGQGAHYCIGSPLARLEGQIAISTLLQRLPNLRLKFTSDKLQWRSNTILRGLKALPVTC